MKLEYIDPKKDNWFLVTWDLGNKCNYRCSYCPSMFNDGSTGWPAWKDVEHFVKKINEELPHKDICFRISGGEPTYWKHFLDFAELAKSYGNSFSFLTNGSRDIKYFEAINKFTDGIILSYHPEYSNFEHFIEISKVIDGPIAVNLMMVPERFNDIMAVAKQLYDNSSLAIWPKLVLDKIDMTNIIATYTEEQRSVLDKWPYFRKLDDSQIHRGGILLDGKEVSANDLMLAGLNKHIGWECWAGLDMINIDFTGNIFRSNCEQGGTLGKINNFVLPKTTLICGKETCNCLSDIYLKKIKILKV